MPVNHGALRNSTGWLKLLQLADSALPIGALSHSFGVESLEAEGGLDVPQLGHFFAEWLESNGHMEAVFCVLGHAANDQAAWTQLNAGVSAMRPARESRDASLTLGRRFLVLAASLEDEARLRFTGPVHLCTAFGLVGAALGLSPEESAGALLHQALFGAVSACQRILPFGQLAAMQLLWDLKSRVAATIEAACAQPEMSTIRSLQPRLEIASMRHPLLRTRLFIS